MITTVLHELASMIVPAQTAVFIDAPRGKLKKLCRGLSYLVQMNTPALRRAQFLHRPTGFTIIPPNGRLVRHALPLPTRCTNCGPRLLDGRKKAPCSILGNTWHDLYIKGTQRSAKRPFTVVNDPAENTTCHLGTIHPSILRKTSTSALYENSNHHFNNEINEYAISSSEKYDSTWAVS
jgi:hypothetical protein